MSAPYGWILKGGVTSHTLHRLVKMDGVTYFPVKPKCGTRVDRTCLENVYEKEGARWASDELCKRCFKKAEREERKAEEDKRERERVERMDAYRASLAEK